MKIFIGTDHAGFELKEKLIPFLKELGHEVKDFGAFSYNKDDDYPDFVIPVAKVVAKNNGAMGIVLGGSGEGEAIACNRIPGARATVFYGHASAPRTDASGKTLGIVESAREHNNANILSLAAGFLSEQEAKEAVKVFLETPFSGDERHERRLHKIDKHLVVSFLKRRIFLFIFLFVAVLEAAFILWFIITFASA